MKQLNSTEISLFFSRACYPGPVNFSTQDRIALVYRLLRTIPFGDPQNYRGVDR